MHDDETMTAGISAELALAGGEAMTRLGEMLGFDGPAPPAVTRRAIEDEQYARYLLMTKDIPHLQDSLLALAAGEASPEEGARDRAAAGASSVRLLARGSAATVRWGKAGFRTAGEEMKRGRLAACGACPHLVDAPDTILYKGVRMLAGSDAKICSGCGCLVERKAALPTERCPMRDPADPSVSRWGEPFDASAA